MNLVKLDSGFNIEVEFPLTAFHKRFFAWAIDILVVVGYNLLLNKLYPAGFARELWLIALLELPPVLYHLICEITMNGQSAGKKLLGIRVISADGGHPSISQFLIRWLFRLIDLPWWLMYVVFLQIWPWWTAVFIFGGLLSLILSPYSQRLGDLVAGTIIIDTRNRTSWEDTVFTELENDYQPRFPQVMRLTDKDINTLKSIIGVVRKKSDYDLSMRIGDRIKAKLQIDSDQDSLEFLETLLKDYNYFSTR